MLSQADYRFLRFSWPHPAVLLATMNRPKKLNAIDDDGHVEILRLLDHVEEDRDVNVLMLTGSGRAFCAGGDVSGPPFNDRDDGIEAAHQLAERNVRTVNRLVAFQKPLVAAVNGVAVGAGLRLALLADINVVAVDAQLIDGHHRLGVTAGDHAALLWPLLCGMARSKYYLMTGRTITGQDAAEMGLVTLAVPAEAVLDEALKLAIELAEGPQHAIRGTKRVLNHWLRTALPAYEHSAALEALNFLHPDSTVAARSLQKRAEPAPPAGSPRPGVGRADGEAGGSTKIGGADGLDH
ncbi:MAG TPA: enoyl-CoA hydratase-related protein [Acidimicrobiales bacterium]|jgi:enoyl-CoA hydratase|nr:enoyl-CoA hydratase-related protein [Acidimicrobiales bacterium]